MAHMRTPPKREELERLVNAALPLPERIANMRIFYDCISDRDEELERRRRIIERQDEEMVKLKAKVEKLERELRSRPKTPAQVQALALRSERQAQALLDTHQQVESLAETANALAEQLEQVLTTPD